ncbi:MAG: MarR family winged helix-turn-helix transcriptional regulator [Pseudomonadota bacterium]
MQPPETTDPNAEPMDGDIESVGRIPDSDLYPDDIEEFLTYHLNILARKLSRRHSRFLNENFDMALAEWWLLAQISQHSPTTVRDLAARTLIDKAQVSRGIEQLRNREYVRREIDPSDKRSALFYITPSGESAYAQIMPARRANQSELLSQLTREERDVFRRSIGKLSAYLDDNEPG